MGYPSQIPPLAEVLSHTGTSGLTAVSTFSGAGGSSLGLRWAGWDVPVATEFVEAAADTYRANMPTTRLLTGDMRDITPDQLAEAAGTDQLDLLEGSPPCSAFSTLGIGRKGWGQEKGYSDGKTQQVDDLFLIWLDLAAALRPRALLAENVPALAGKTGLPIWRQIIARTRQHGYTPHAAVLSGWGVGVPQKRRRLIFVAFRDDLNISWQFPSPLPMESRPDCSQAMPWWVDPEVPHPDPAHPRDGVTPDPDWPRLLATRTELLQPLPDPETGRDIQLSEHYWKRWGRLDPGVYDPVRYTFCRAPLHGPCPTVAVGGRGGGHVVAPHQPRRFTLAELRRLGGFPDDFRLTGAYRHGYERIARAVVPPLYREVGRKLVEVLS